MFLIKSVAISSELMLVIQKFNFFVPKMKSQWQGLVLQP